MRTDGAIDIQMIVECKKRFVDLYEKSNDDRNKLRGEDAYQLCLMDLFEMGATAKGMADTNQEFFYLLGQAAFGLMSGKVQITGNVDSGTNK